MLRARSESLGVLVPSHVRDLSVTPEAHPRGQTHLSAASGLVRVHDRLYVVADDEQHLGMFDDQSPTQTPLRLLRIVDGDLPLDKDERKARKPDFEVLMLLPAAPAWPWGALLAMGSGSRPARETAVRIPLDANGNPVGPPRRIALAGLYAPLRTQFGDLNLEGGFVADRTLCLLQRGNRGDARNACILFDWAAMADWLAGQQPEPPRPRLIQHIALGEAAGVPLSLTDGAALADGAWVFCAVAEDTVDSFQDGACLASAVGIVDAAGEVLSWWTLGGAPKVEGVSVHMERDGLQLDLVTDADNPALASRLLRVRLPSAKAGPRQ